MEKTIKRLKELLQSCPSNFNGVDIQGGNSGSTAWLHHKIWSTDEVTLSLTNDDLRISSVDKPITKKILDVICKELELIINSYDQRDKSAEILNIESQIESLSVRLKLLKGGDNAR